MSDETDFKKIIDTTNKSIEKFMSKVPKVQRALLRAIQEEIKDLELDGRKRIKTSIRNVAIIGRIQSKLAEVILTPEYKTVVKEFLKSFNDVTNLQTDYFKKHVDKRFKPKSIVKAIKQQAIEDTARKLTETGIASELQDNIGRVLQNNITGNGTYAGLTKEFTEMLTDTQKSDGMLTRYAGQIVTDSINQYAARYTQLISNDLKMYWRAYQGSDIPTTRPFCDAMTDRRYFHLSEIPSLLKAENLYYTDNKTGKIKKVPLNNSTGLPHGQYADTTPATFLDRRGGYRCRHQIRPVPENRVPKDIVDRVKLTAAYKAFTGV